MTQKGRVLPPAIDVRAPSRAYAPLSPARPEGSRVAQARMAPGPPPMVYGRAPPAAVQRKVAPVAVGRPPLAWAGARANAVQRSAELVEAPKVGPVAIKFSGCLPAKVPDAQAKAVKGWTTAISYLEKVISLLEGQGLEGQEKLFNACFSCSSAEGGATVLKVLKATLEGLKRNDITLNLAYFNYAISNGTVLTLAIAQMNSDNQRVRYIIHEATHMFAGTSDAAGYIGNDWAYKNGVPTKESALLNADSFACFVVGCMGIDLT